MKILTLIEEIIRVENAFTEKCGCTFLHVVVGDKSDQPACMTFSLRYINTKH